MKDDDENDDDEDDTEKKIKMLIQPKGVHVDAYRSVHMNLFTSMLYPFNCHK